MSGDKCTARYKRDTQIFWEFVYVDGEKEYTCMITKIKEISLEFVDDLEGVPAVLRSIIKRTGQHLKKSISVRHHVQMRFDPYLNMDKGWDDSIEELVTDCFKLVGDTSRTVSKMHYRIAILWSNVRPEIVSKVRPEIVVSHTAPVRS